MVCLSSLSGLVVLQARFRLLTRVLLAWVVVFPWTGNLAFAAGDPPPVSGKDYQLLANPVTPVATDSTDKIQVIEFFWYGCPHCYQTQPYVESWLQNKPDFVAFQRVPAPFGQVWDLHAKAFYAAETMGVLDKTHQATFDAIHRDKKTLVRMKQIKAFYQQLGVDGDAFVKTAESFIVALRLNQAKEMLQDYQLQSVPVLAVAGKYLVSPVMSSGNQGMIQTLNYLVQQEYQQRQVSSTSIPQHATD